jgi:dihydrofolate synthase/folylpolyglutamate synthase
MTSGDSLGRALSKLYGRIPLGMRLGLEPMRAACARFGNPERAFAAVHVAGTNGKGSVCAMVEAIARCHGLTTGLYTSPHLCRFAERICIDGTPIEDAKLAGLLLGALADPADLSFFEAATLAAFLAFRDAAVDVAVVEVGLGGRLDATNVLPLPRAAAITRIALDHTDRLGSTLVDIAREKAGIAKPGLDIVLGPMSPDVREAIDAVARLLGATTSSAADGHPPFAVGTVGLPGDHQVDNARIAAVLGRRLGASAESILRGIASVHWPGRLERIGPYLFDAAHNPDGAAALARHVRSLSVPPERTALLFGALSDKDWKPMLEVLAPLARSRVYLPPAVPAAASRSAVDPRAMAAVAPGRIASTVSEALAVAGGELIVVAGSMMLVGGVRACVLALPCDPLVPL